MPQDLDLATFWELLETNFPLAESRSKLRRLLTPSIVRALEESKVLKYLRESDRVPCPSPGGDGCPRHVIELGNGKLVGVCGNHPPECHEIELTKDDVALLGVDPIALCSVLRGPLGVGGEVQELPGRRNVFRIGAFRPDSKTRHCVYLVVCCTEHEYKNAFDALRSHRDGKSFAAVVPTERFINEDTIRQMSTLGVPVVSLHLSIGVRGTGQLITRTKPQTLFAGIGQRGVLRSALSSEIVAQICTHDGWVDADQSKYDEVVESRDAYDLVADETKKKIWKREDGKKPHRHYDNCPARYYGIIREAVDKTGYFDPGRDASGDLEDAKQLFQRARNKIDVKYDDSDNRQNWRLFKSVRVEGHTEYVFRPDENYRFALIFSPRS